MQKTDQLYRREEELVEVLCSALVGDATPWGPLAVAREFGYLRGRTDVIAVDESGRVIAFEAKLSRWRDALQQAYRNTCFAHLSYVALPQHAARKAQQFPADFARRAVGICCVLDGSIVVSIPARRQEPIQPWLSELASAYVRDTDE